MKRMQKSAIVAMALAVMAMVGAGSASATTLEVGGVTKNESITLTMTLAPGASMITEDTPGTSLKKCKKSELKGSTEGSFTGATLSGSVGTLTFAECDRAVTVHKAGTLSVSHIAGTTNGTVSSDGTHVTKGSPFGTLTCITAGTHIGTLTGVASGHATLHVNAVLNCGISARWTGTYTVTSPTGLGVSP
jgi:hypothetical protein